ncbi:MAG: CoA transferase, partial [Thermomicrobiales bacterium]|nr:CoA transferase [Thermomicrobiales bacterium]
LPALADDPRFANFGARHLNREALLAILAERFSAAPTAHWVALLQGTVPVAPVRSLPEVLNHSQLADRDMLASFTHPQLGPVHSVGLPIHVSGYTPRYRASPAPGAHTRDALRAAGLSDAEISRLAREGAFGEEA